jgi:hydroxyethylthiazole kinase-like uncharacterized protein yjeF
VKIVNVEEMRAIEHASDARGHTYAVMMDMAGKAVAEAAATFVLREPAKQVVVLVGPGNNGGDGLVTSRYLLDLGMVVTVYLWRRNIKGDKNFQQLKRSGRRRGLDILWADNDPDYAHLREHLQTADLIIDALLGTGASRPIDGKLAEILGVVKEAILERRRTPEEPELGRPLQFPMGEAYTLGMEIPTHERPVPENFWDDFEEDFEEDEDEIGDDEDDAEDAEDFLDDFDDFEDDDDFDDDDPFQPHWPPLPVIAVDCPSGLNSDTGELDTAAIHAQMTVTFAYPKWGQVQFPGAGACGVLAVADIGVPPGLDDHIQVELVRPADARALLPARPPDANKGTFGKAMVVAGSSNYTGAAYLSAASAGRAGAGLVTLAVPAPLHALLAAVLPETTWLALPDEGGIHCQRGAEMLLAGLASYRALLVGPGLTTQPAARAFMEALFSGQGLVQDTWRGRVVADADGLNILSGWPDWPARLPRETILTPHPGEMSRLTGLTVAEINGRRIETACKFAATWGHILVLKGAHTVIAAPDGRAAVLPFATPALATAGSGDVLSGTLVALLAQGLAPFDAAVCGTYIHGHAGLIAQREVGLAGVVAGDIMQRLPHAIRQLWSL